MPSAATLTGDAATAQAGRIRRQFDRLPPVSRVLLVLDDAPRELACICRAPCCAGRYANAEWRKALERRRRKGNDMACKTEILRDPLARNRTHERPKPGPQ